MIGGRTMELQTTRFGQIETIEIRKSDVEDQTAQSHGP